MIEGLYVVNYASFKRPEEKVDTCTGTSTTQQEVYKTYLVTSQKIPIYFMWCHITMYL